MLVSVSAPKNCPEEVIPNLLMPTLMPREVQEIRDGVWGTMRVKSSLITLSPPTHYYQSLMHHPRRQPY